MNRNQNTQTATQDDVNAYVDHAISKSRFVENPLIVNETVPDLSLGAVSPGLSGKMQEEYGVDISGKRHVLTDNDIRHIFNRHGPHTKEAMPVTADDIKAIPYIIENADDVYYLPRDDGKSGLMYQYRHNGTTYYLEQIVENENVLRNKQMIKVPTGTIPNVKGLRDAINKKHASSLPGDAAGAVPQMYVQDVRNGMFSDSSVPQSAPENNPNSAQTRTAPPVQPRNYRAASEAEVAENIRQVRRAASALGKSGSRALAAAYTADVARNYSPDGRGAGLLLGLQFRAGGQAHDGRAGRGRERPPRPDPLRGGSVRASRTGSGRGRQRISGSTRG